MVELERSATASTATTLDRTPRGIAEPSRAHHGAEGSTPRRRSRSHHAFTPGTARCGVGRRTRIARSRRRGAGVRGMATRTGPCALSAGVSGVLARNHRTPGGVAAKSCRPLLGDRRSRPAVVQPAIDHAAPCGGRAPGWGHLCEDELSGRAPEAGSRGGGLPRRARSRSSASSACSRSPRSR